MALERTRRALSRRPACRSHAVDFLLLHSGVNFAHSGDAAVVELGGVFLLASITVPSAVSIRKTNWSIAAGCYTCVAFIACSHLASK